jgi:hypothetical protein
MLVLILLSFSSAYAGEKKPAKSPARQANQAASCVTFDGTGAKKTFLALYPHTQGNVTAISAEESKLGDTSISAKNIFCRVWAVNLPKGLDAAVKALSKIDPSKFQCGYFVYSEGNLAACSDPL